MNSTPKTTFTTSPITSTPSTLTPTQVAAIHAVAEALYEAVKVAGERGVSGGLLYAAVCGQLSLATFESFMRALVQSMRVRKAGHIYYATSLKAV